MSRLFKLKVAIFLCGVLLCNSLYGQFLEGVGDRASVKWRQMSGPTYKVIYPKGEDSLALKYLWLLEQNREATMLGLGLEKSAKVPVVLHNRTANSNGLVTWAPKRMELFAIPSPDTYSHIWEEQLAIHEARHVGQMTHFTKGIFKGNRAVKDYLTIGGICINTEITLTHKLEGCSRFCTQQGTINFSVF
jgi:hypothetical protein